MFSNWLDNLNSPIISGDSDQKMINSIELWNVNSEMLQKNDITIVYSDKIDPHYFRSLLFNKFAHFNTSIIELGQLKKSSSAFLLPFIKEVIATNRLIYIGPKEDLNEILGLNEAHKLGLNKSVFIENSIQKTNKFTNHIGFQRHQTSADIIASINDFCKCSLGNLKHNIRKTEPIIRDRAYVNFDLTAIEKRLTNLENACITGLNIEESCQIAKYSGHSSKLKIFHLAVPSQTKDKDWSEVASLICWYLLEGMDNCLYESVEDTDNQSYLVSSDFMEKPIKFIKGKLSGRWWLENPNSQQTPEYIPCELDDYTNVSQGIIPDKFLSLQ